MQLQVTMNLQKWYDSKFGAGEDTSCSEACEQDQLFRSRKPSWLQVGAAQLPEPDSHEGIFWSDWKFNRNCQWQTINGLVLLSFRTNYAYDHIVYVVNHLCFCSAIFLFWTLLGGNSLSILSCDWGQWWASYWSWAIRDIRPWKTWCRMCWTEFRQGPLLAQSRGWGRDTNMED